MHLFRFTSTYHFNLCLKEGCICTHKWAVFTGSRQCCMQQQVLRAKERSNSAGIRTSAAWLPRSWSCQVSQCHSPGVSPAPPHCPFSLPGQQCQLQASGLAFSRDHATLLAQHNRLVLLLSSQADATESAKDSCWLTSPLLSPLTPTDFFLPSIWRFSHEWQQHYTQPATRVG